MSKTFPLIWNQKARSVEFSLSERLHSEMQEFLFDVEKYIDLEGFSVVSAWSNKDIEALRDEFFLSFDRSCAPRTSSRNDRALQHDGLS